MNRNTKLVLLISLFGLVCLAILWGRWFPDNSRQETADIGLDFESDRNSGGSDYLHSPSQPSPEDVRTILIGPGSRSGVPPRTDDIHPPTLGDRDQEERDRFADARGPRVPSPPEVPEDWRKYTVKKNDSLWLIAQKLLGDGSRHGEIARANPDVNPQNLKLGKVLLIPPRDRSSSTSTPPASSPAPSPGGTTPAPPRGQPTVYVVQGGDSFSRIASRELGSSRRWKEIPQLNGLSEDAVINPGDKLRLPAR